MLIPVVATSISSFLYSLALNLPTGLSCWAFDFGGSEPIIARSLGENL